MSDTLKAWARGEPVTLAALIAAITAAVGYPIASDRVATIVTGVVTVVGLFVARKNTTSAANPVIPTTIAVKPDEAETPADLPPLTLPPVRTFGGKR